MTEIKLKTVNAALDIAHAHVCRTIEILEQDDEEDERIELVREELEIIGEAQRIVKAEDAAC